jgi:hypothetical protein
MDVTLCSALQNVTTNSSIETGAAILVTWFVDQYKWCNTTLDIHNFGEWD